MIGLLGGNPIKELGILMKELGYDSLPTEKQKQMTIQMLEDVDKRINLMVLSILTEKEKKELYRVGDMIKFLRGKIPNFDILVTETVADYKNEILKMQRTSLEIFAPGQPNAGEQRVAGVANMGFLELLRVDIEKELFNELGFYSLRIETQRKLSRQMSEALEDRIGRAVFSRLTEKEKKEFLDDANEDMINFFRCKIPSFDILVAETITDFKNEIVNMQKSYLENPSAVSLK